MQIAFKEWAVVVDALGRGGQILILRKGGVSEGRGGFQVDHERFLLFPTAFHQQRESVVPAAQDQFARIAPQLSTASVRIEYFAQVMEWCSIDSVESALRLHGQHIWREEVIRERFDWGSARSIYALAVRVFRLPAPKELPMRPEYGGCKSWVNLGIPFSTTGATPVLDEHAFSEKLERFRAALGEPNHPGAMSLR